MNTQGRIPKKGITKGHENLLSKARTSYEAPKNKKFLQGAKITRKTKLSEVLEAGENAAEILFNAGMSCIGCPMSAGESLEQGCKAHGMNKKDIDKLVVKLNKKK